MEGPRHRSKNSHSQVANDRRGKPKQNTVGIRGVAYDYSQARQRRPLNAHSLIDIKMNLEYMKVSLKNKSFQNS